MSAALKLIVAGLTVVNLSTALPTKSSSSSVVDIEVVFPDQPFQHNKTKRIDYTYTPGIGAHKVHTQAVNWNSARQTCMGEGGRLAIINSRKESEVIAGLVANSGTHVGSVQSDYVHIGFHDLYHEGQYVTITGEPIETVGFNEWANGEPSSGLGGLENCGSIYKDGKLNDISCTNGHGFVCELPDVLNSDSDVEDVQVDQPVQLSVERDTYTYNLNISTEKVRSQAANWNWNRKIYIEESGQPAITNPRAESKLIVKLVAN